MQRAVKEKLADPKTLVADTTAQEASIPYPNEMGLMSGLPDLGSRAARKVGQGLKGFVQQTGSQFKAARQKAREYRLFAKSIGEQGSSDEADGQPYQRAQRSIVSAR